MKKITFFLLSVILSSFIVSSVSHAVDVDFYSNNGIFFYDQNAGNNLCPVNFIGDVTISGEDNIERMFNWFVGKGLSGTQAAGVLGNIRAESGFSPTRQEDSKKGTTQGGWGIVQWTGGRRTSIRNYISEQDPSLSKYESDTSKYGGAVSASNGYVHPDVPLDDNNKLLKLQLDFLYSESTSRTVGVTASGDKRTAAHETIATTYKDMKEWDAIKKATSIQDVSNIWLFSFEKPADQGSAHQATRVQYGEEILNAMSGDREGDREANSSPEVRSGAQDCSTGGGGTAGFISKVISYVHPTYTPKYFIGKENAKKEYVTAVDKAKSEGRYTGDASNYADCGGLVSLLVTDSGFDKNYNGTNTSNQINWLRDSKNGWSELGKANEIDTLTLQPGDIFWRTGHTFIYIGDVPGFETKIASASLNERVPMSGTEDISDAKGVWFRKV